MDLLNQFIAQLTTTFRSLSLGARIVSGLLIVVTVISLAFLFNRQLAAPDSFLFGGAPVTAAELPNIEAAFGSSNLKNYTIEGNRIRVPRGEESTYMAALAENNALPAEFGSYLQKALSEVDLWSSSKKQQEKLKYSIQMELAQMIRKMSGVESASVLYDIKEEGGLNRKKLFSASVAVKTLNSVPLDESRVQSIRQLVAAAFAGMTPESVAVTDLTHNRTFPAGRAGELLSGTQDPSYQTKIAYEGEWTRKIQNALGYIRGTLVTVNVQLNTELEESERKVTYEAKTVLTSQQETTETNSVKSGAAGPGGRPGLTTQGGVSNQGLSLSSSSVVQAGGSTDKETSLVNNRFATPGSESSIRRAGLTPKRVSVSVGIPMSYYEQIWQDRNPAAAGQQPRKPSANELNDFVAKENERITMYIVKQLPPRDIENPDKEPKNDISVHAFHELAAAPPTPPSIAETALGWLGGHWSSIGTGLLGLFSLVMLRSLVKAIPTPTAERGDNATPAIDAAANAVPVVGDAAGATGDPNAPPARRLQRKNKTGNSLRDELVEIVREDPDTAASILRSWISNAN